MSILVTIGYIAVCVLLFSLAIAIHEFGHFIVALKLGLTVEAFSIGFGPAIWKKKINGVEYRLSWIPLGGYVSIPDVDPEGTKVLEQGSGARKERIAPWKEIAVSFAGPGMNLVLAVVLALLLSMIPQAKFGTLKSVIGYVPEEGPAAQAGMMDGDRVVAVGGHPVETWTEMQTEIQIVGGKWTEITVERGEETLTLDILPARDQVSGAYFILALSETNAYRSAAWMPERNPLKQLAWDAGSIFRVLKGLGTPKEMRSTAGALGGPVMIAEGIYNSIRRDCWDGIGFLRFLNVNLAIVNLLPIPVLDGGIILFALIALVFRRRIPDAVVSKVSMVFVYLLCALMGVLILKDIRRSWRIHTHKGSGEAAELSSCEEAETNAVQEVEKGE